MIKMSLEENLKERAKEKRLSEKIKFIALELGGYSFCGARRYKKDPSILIHTNTWSYEEKGTYFEVGSSIFSLGGKKCDWVRVKKKRWFSKKFKLVYCDAIYTDFKCFGYKPGKWEDKLEKIFNKAMKKE